MWADRLGKNLCAARCSARLAVALVQRSKASRYRFLEFSSIPSHGHSARLQVLLDGPCLCVTGMHLHEQGLAEFAEGNHECSLYQLRDHHSSHIGEPIRISARFSLLLALIFGRHQRDCQYCLGLAFGAAHCDVFVHPLVLMFQGLIQCKVLLGCHLGDLAFTTKARITGTRFGLRQRGLRSERAGRAWWKAPDPAS